MLAIKEMQKLSPNSKGRCKRLIIIEPQKFEKISQLQNLLAAKNHKTFSQSKSLPVDLNNFEFIQFSEIISLSDSL